MNKSLGIKNLIHSKSSRAVLLFVVIASMQFVYYFSNYGPITFTDAIAHVPGAYSLATGQSLNATFETSNKIEVGGCYGTKHLQEINLPENLYFENNNTFKSGILSGLVQELSDDKRESQREELTDMKKSTHMMQVYTQANQYFPIAYMPTALGMKVGMLLGKSSWGILQLGRISNFIFYLAIMIISIIVVPRGKLALATIGLFPQCIFCASSLMVDSILIATCSLYVCVALHFIFNNKQIQKKWQMVGIGILTAFIMFIKLPFGALALLYILMPKHIWKTKTKAITCAVTALVFALTYLMWSMNFQLMYFSLDVDYFEQLSFFREHFIFVIANCILNGLMFVTVTLPFSYSQMFIFVAIIVAGILIKYGPAITIYVSMSVLATILIIAATYIFLYITWNSYQGISPHLLGGFQERYLIPLFPLLLTMCQKQRFSDNVT